MHFETFGPVTLYLGNAIEILPELDEKADLLMTDPPYKLTRGGKRKQVMSGIFASENYDNSGELMDVIAWSDMARPLYDACKENADGYVMANDKNVFEAHSAFCQSGWKYHNLLVWDKGAPTRNRWYMKNLEFTLYFWKGRARTINTPGSKQLFSCPRPRQRFHRTQKPVRLMAHYIRNSTQPGDLVLDPFAGSGSTLVAAMRYGRRAIGCECNTEWFEKTCERLRKELQSLHSVVALQKRQPVPAL